MKHFPELENQVSKLMTIQNQKRLLNMIILIHH